MMTNAGMGAWLEYLSTLVTKMGVGTGITPPNVSDTQLATEVLTKAIGGVRIAGTAATFETLFADNEANADLTEWGLSNNSIFIARGLFVTTVEKTSEYEMIVSVTMPLQNDGS